MESLAWCHRTTRRHQNLRLGLAAPSHQLHQLHQLDPLDQLRQCLPAVLPDQPGRPVLAVPLLPLPLKVPLDPPDRLHPWGQRCRIHLADRVCPLAPPDQLPLLLLADQPVQVHPTHLEHLVRLDHLVAQVGQREVQIRNW